MDDYLDKLRSDIRDKSYLLQQLEKVQQKFPDLKIDCDRWNKERYFSKEANTLVDRVDFFHSCGCCFDAPLMAAPYLIYEGIPIYSNPARICIGQRNDYGCGERPSENWRTRLEEAGLPQSIIDQVQLYFDENPPIEEEDDEN